MSSLADGSEAALLGDPKIRPDLGNCVLSLNPSMLAWDDEYRGKALMATVGGLHPPASAQDLVNALEAIHHIRSCDMLVEVRAPTDFMVTFQSATKCTLVFKDSTLLYLGVSVSLAQWHPGWGASESSELPFLTKLSFDALPRRAWDRETVKKLLNVLQGELVKIFSLKNSWCLSAIAWLKEPSQVPKVLYVELLVQEATMVDDAPEPPSQKTQPTFKHRVLVHVQ
jgi:hypothetical protein